MSFSVKPGTVIDRLHARMADAIPICVRVLNRHGVIPATITEGNDTIGRKHRSFHKGIPCRALDWRTWADDSGKQLSDDKKQEIVNELQVELGIEYDVTFGKLNIHTEFDPN